MPACSGVRLLTPTEPTKVIALWNNFHALGAKLKLAVPAEPLDDTVTSRTTLRLPDRLKARVEQAAAEEGVSVNSWFVRAIAAALEPNSHRAPRRETKQGDSFTGWAR